MSNEKPTAEQKQEIENNLMVFCFKCAARTNNEFIKNERTYGKLGESIEKNSKPMSSLTTINNDLEIYDNDKKDYKIIKHYECGGDYVIEYEINNIKTNTKDKIKETIKCKEYLTAKYGAKKDSNLDLKETLKQFDGSSRVREMFFTYLV